MKSINEIRYQAQKLMNELLHQEMKEKKPFNQKRYFLISEICETYNLNCVKYLQNTEAWNNTIYGKFDIKVKRENYMRKITN